jgi:hypothetical protein
MTTRAFLSVLLTLIACAATSDARDAVAGTRPSAASSPDDRVLAGRKLITVYADSEAAAFAEANRKNPGWTAIKAKKTGGGRAYQVTMVME